MTKQGLLHRIFSTLGDCRVAEREPRDGQVMLSWRDRYGEGLAFASCRDISDGGIGIECLEPIPLKAVVRVHLRDNRIVRPAVIRYRAKRGAAYVLGLEFTQGVAAQTDVARDELDMATEGMTW